MSASPQVFVAVDVGAKALDFSQFRITGNTLKPWGNTLTPLRFSVMRRGFYNLLSRFCLGRVLLHLGCLFRSRNRSFHVAGIIRDLKELLRLGR